MHALPVVRLKFEEKKIKNYHVHLKSQRRTVHGSNSCDLHARPSKEDLTHRPCIFSGVQSEVFDKLERVLSQLHTHYRFQKILNRPASTIVPPSRKVCAAFCYKLSCESSLETVSDTQNEAYQKANFPNLSIKIQPNMKDNDLNQTYLACLDKS